jgi:hypothetical protein
MRTVLFVNEFTEFSYSRYKGIIYWRVLVTNVNNSSVIQIKTAIIYKCYTVLFWKLMARVAQWVR